MSSRPRSFAGWCASLAISIAAGATMAEPSSAADASQWDGDERSTVRLIAGKALVESAGRILRGGVEIKLAPGWKTYWRYPGDAGVPPRFNFAESENVETITLLWPAPRRFTQDGVSYIGYERHVILPLRVVPRDGRKGVTVRLKLDYGVCEKLCVPAEARVELLFADNVGHHEQTLKSAEARVPKPVAIGQGETLAIASARRDLGSTSARVIVDVVAPARSNLDLFVEGPTPDWALPLPAPVAAPGEVRRFAFELAGAPPDATARGVTLKLTAVTDNEAIEVPAFLE